MQRAGRVVVLLAFVGATLGVAGTGSAQPPSDWLATWNAYRAQSGLPPVAEDPAKSEADRLHAQYMLVNQDITHDEDPSAPGYTPQGADAAQRSNVLGDGDVNFPDGRAIETWLTGPFHAIGMLDPVLASVGFGSARDAAAGSLPYTAAAWADVGEPTAPDPGVFPILFPGDGATMPLTTSCCEFPSPTEGCGYPDDTGLILTAQLQPAFSGTEPSVNGSSFRRIAPDVADLEHCLVPGSQYVNAVPEDQDYGRQRLSGAAYLVPRAALQDGATYEAVIAYDGTEARWTFTVGPLGGGPVVPPTGPAEQIVEETATATAIAVSRERFADGSAALAVVTRDDDFADALAGTPLLADGTLLFTPTAQLPPEVAAELQRVLPPGSEVVVLGGDAAVSPAVRQQIAALGYEVTGLSGPTRIDTAVAVAGRVAPEGIGTVALARAFGTPTDPTAAWVDSISAGAWLADAGAPLLLTPQEEVAPVVAQALADLGVSETLLLGGTAALSQAVEDAVPGAFRIAGSTRAGTAVAIAQELVGTTAGAVLVDGSSDVGWIAGLAAAGVAADRDAPVLLGSAGGLPPETDAALPACADDHAALLVLGRSAYVAAVQNALAARAAAAPC